MNTINLVLGGLGADRSRLVSLTKDILRENQLEYDHKVDFNIQYESSSNHPIWVVSFQTAPNPFGFESETYWVEFTTGGEFIDILTPRGRMSNIRGAVKSKRNSLLAHY